MKDIEKIQSPDLGCQVQDANPANFAIEQEVAQLVGATVPAPTEPSADDARELGAQLLVFLRRALLPIRSALRTALAAIYAHLDSRCTDYTPAAYDPFRLPAGPYDPMRPFAPRTLPNLLTALTAFAPRKISNGSAPSDGIPDGTSLAHILCCSDIAVTKLIDDNYGWVMDKMIQTDFAFTHIKLCCKEILNSRLYHSPSLNSLKELIADEVKTITRNNGAYDTHIINGYTALETISMKGLEHYYMGNRECFITNCYVEHIYLDSLVSLEGYSDTAFQSITGCDDLLLPKFEYWKGVNSMVENPMVAGCSFKRIIAPNWSQMAVNQDTSGNRGKQGVIANCQYLEELEVGTLTLLSGTLVRDCPKLIKIVIGQDTAINLNMKWWEPDETVLDGGTNQTTFLQNFREHIALRLTANGSGKTLTLSRAVRDAIHAAEETYGIEAIIVTQKGWRIQPDAS